MTMTTVEVLRAARKTIENPDVWGHGQPGCVLRGLCAHLAIGEAAPSRSHEVVALRAFARSIGRLPSDSVIRDCEVIWEFNDSHTHAEVLAAFDRAIANEEAREAEFTSGVEEVEPVAAAGEMVLA